MKVIIAVPTHLVNWYFGATLLEIRSLFIQLGPVVQSPISTNRVLNSWAQVVVFQAMNFEVIDKTISQSFA